jgi:hypothetical protein
VTALDDKVGLAEAEGRAEHRAAASMSTLPHAV